MYLKKLEILGFKSFRAKTKFEFDKGITAVVGPNGSGKSNVSDAIRWVLGEQSVKSLRGSKMEDIIFAGTLNKKPLGLASVSIYIDNSEKKMQLPYDEVIITRKLFRSGESEFQINGTECRLKDIHGLFMDTGIGREGYSIIGQGNVEELLSSKGGERRKIFEEAAGIIKYKSRRDEAFIKLEREKQNLLQVQSIIEELEDRLPVLHSESDKAKKYLAIAEEIKLLKINIFLLEKDKLSEEIEKLNKNLKDLSEQIADEGDKKYTFQKSLEESKKEIALADGNIEANNAKIADIKLKTEQKESKIALSKEQIKTLQEEINRLKDDIQKKQNNILKNESDISDININLADLKNQISEISKELQSKEENLLVVNEEIAELENEIKDINNYVMESITEINTVKSDISRLEFLINQLQEKKKSINASEKDNEKIFSRSSIGIKTLTDESSELENKILLVKERIELMLQKKLALEESQNKYTNDLVSKAKAINDIRARLKILIEVDENFEGYHRGVKSILKFKKNNPNKLRGVINIVGEVINVPKHLEVAMEVSFGSSIQNIITYTEEDAEEAIAFLKASKSGRATFLPISGIKKRNADINLRTLGINAVVGIAKDLISYDSKFENIMHSLIGNIIIIDTIENAISISKQNNYLYRMVTLDGELINPSGAITGGTLNKSLKILGRNADIEKLKNQLNVLYEEEKTLLNNKEVQQKELKDILAKIEENNKLWHKHDLESLRISQDIKQEKKSLELSIKNKESYNAEKINIENEMNKNKEEIKTLEEMQFILEKDKVEAGVNIESYQSKISEYQNKKESLANEITNMKIDITSRAQKLDFGKQNIQGTNRLALSYKQEVENSELEIKKFIKSKEDKLQNLKNLQSEIKKLNSSKDKTSKNLETLLSQKEKLILDYEKIQFDDRQELEVISNLKTEEARLKIRIENLELKKSNSYNELWEEYELTYQKALKYRRLDKPLEEMKKEIKQLKEDTKNLGSINLSSIEEYKQSRDKFNFLVDQKLDIEEAEQKLKTIIVDFTQLMEEKFSEQFNIVSKNFSMVFQEIFGGGTAHLKLSSETDLLQAEIDIIAQPPGKRLQSMSLMSGGEKSLTAIALLFSILHMKPSPFCVLDEIEAALDDVNNKKFARYLHKLSINTQFIVITHKKATMEIANNIYGVTMEEEGISKLLSVNLD